MGGERFGAESDLYIYVRVFVCVCLCLCVCVFFFFFVCVYVCVCVLNFSFILSVPLLPGIASIILWSLQKTNDNKKAKVQTW